ncbi:olfactory receptor 13J1 [Sarcophilus harrisii]|uniref:Olfactory receptor n=1 Tax=Sarcophilus harrisii TaxID=9305 RepID=G3VSD7_SARHA|nr:olfactory receptor 13J1 [Sarcophilus harrisii]
METVNATVITEFFLKGFSIYPRLESLLFVLCLVMYLITLVGNGIIIAISILDSHLHTPMYFFLSNLSFLDVCYTSTFIPLMLVNFLSKRKTISFIGCAVQMCLSLATGSTECILLAMMAYDRYVAICHPLRYPIIMNKRVCLGMAAFSWSLSFLKSIMETVIAMQMPFCGHNVVSHFTCEILAILKLICVDTSLNEIIMLVGSIILLPIPVMLIFISYIFILSTILRMNSTEGRHKAISTCSAHLTVVIIFYGTIIFMYMKPKSKEAQISDELFTVLYAVVTPMLNPIIYSLRNKEVKEAVKKVLKKSYLSM